MFTTKKLALLAALAVGALTLVTPPAQAAGASVAQVSGSGNIAPGLTPVPTVQSFTFTSVTITTTGTAVASGNSSCSANGGSTIPETTALGKGAGSWSCGAGALAGCGGVLAYVREGGVVTVDLSARAGSCAGVSGTLECEFTPVTVVPPTTAYSLTCVGEVLSVP